MVLPKDLDNLLPRVARRHLHRHELHELIVIHRIGIRLAHIRHELAHLRRGRGHVGGDEGMKALSHLNSFTATRREPKGTTLCILSPTPRAEWHDCMHAIANKHKH